MTADHSNTPDRILTEGDNQLTSLLNPNQNRPNLTYEFLGITRVWRWTRERMQAEYARGRILQTAPGRVPCYKRYLDEQRGPGCPNGDTPFLRQRVRITLPSQSRRQLRVERPPLAVAPFAMLG